jgi:hypothetical protein
MQTPDFELWPRALPPVPFVERPGFPTRLGGTRLPGYRKVGRAGKMVPLIDLGPRPADVWGLSPWCLNHSRDVKCLTEASRNVRSSRS